MACCCPSLQRSMPSSSNSTDLLLLASCLRCSQSSTLFPNLVVLSLVPTMVTSAPNPVGQVIVVGTRIHEVSCDNKQFVSTKDLVLYIMGATLSYIQLPRVNNPE